MTNEPAVRHSSFVIRHSTIGHSNPKLLEQSKAFTLVELLVVIAIIGVLVSLLLPAINSSREAGRRGQCMDNLKQVALAVLNYETHWGALPRCYTPNDTNSIRYGVCNGGIMPKTTKPGNPENPPDKRSHHYVLSFILPYMEQQSTYDSIDFKVDWNASTATQVDIKSYICPSADTRKGASATDYTTLVNIEPLNYCRRIDGAGLASKKRPVEKLAGMMSDEPLKVANVKDGLSKTFMLFEDAGKPNHYIKGVLQPDNPIPKGKFEWASDKPTNDTHANFIFGNNDQLTCPIQILMNCDNDHEVYSFHPGGVVCAFGDGSVDFIRDNIDVDVFICMFTRAAGDIQGTK